MTEQQATGALAGIRVLDAGLLVQGPQCAMCLAELGADVIKVELPGMGDQSRWIPLSTEDMRFPYFEGCNRGKRSVTVDLRRPEGKEVMRRLVESADVLITNFKSGTMDEWGLGYEELRAVNPRLIYATGSTFGTEGPGAGREGADIAGQAAGGLISTTGVVGGDPTPVGVTIADHIASQNMTSGVLAALFARERTGTGQRVDVSLLGGQIYAQASEYTSYLLSGNVPGRAQYGHPLLSMAYGIVPTADGWLAIVGLPLPVRPAFYELIGHPELLEDERFTPLLYTAEAKRDLFEIFGQVFPSRTTAEWCEELEAIGCRYAPVNDYAAAAADPTTLANGYITEVAGADGSPTQVVGSPIRMSGTPTAPSATAPALGEHTFEVLSELGYSPEELAALAAADTI